MSQSQKVLVAGTGLSGISAAKLLLDMGGEVVLYDSNVQQFILDNIDTIAYYNTQKKSYNFNTEGNI